MPLRTIELPEDLDNFLQQMLASGRYYSQDAIITAALQLFQEKAEDEESKLFLLRKSIQEGIDSDDAEGDVFAQVRAETGLPERRIRA